jgi:ABC-type bacteriocin/lantibiotic exporter with double-glycine peptidase domain
MTETQYLVDILVLLALAVITVSVFQQLFNILQQHYIVIVTHAGGCDHEERAA